ncbi:hypothetical protein [Haloferax sp. YSSS75]|uniref:hypothetical protein n=1 Tax=Haloferax sp. YSSS75 TaxID=3388564 RepID=UPI00398C86C1
MSVLLDILKHIFTGAIELFVLDSAADREQASRQLWIRRLAVVAVIVVSAGVVWTVSSPVRWVGAVVGLLAFFYGLYAELRYE